MFLLADPLIGLKVKGILSDALCATVFVTAYASYNFVRAKSSAACTDPNEGNDDVSQLGTSWS